MGFWLKEVITLLFAQSATDVLRVVGLSDSDTKMFYGIGDYV